METESIDMFDEFNEVNTGGHTDVCPSCGTLLSDLTEFVEGCRDPMGCGAFTEEVEDDSEEDNEIEELNFD